MDDIAFMPAFARNCPPGGGAWVVPLDLVSWSSRSHMNCSEDEMGEMPSA